MTALLPMFTPNAPTPMTPADPLYGETVEWCALGIRLGHSWGQISSECLAWATDPANEVPERLTTLGINTTAGLIAQTKAWWQSNS